MQVRFGAPIIDQTKGLVQPSQTIYNDIKEYFLQKNINIDYIKKNYLFT